jgi:hypothetical protein
MYQGGIMKRKTSFESKKNLAANSKIEKKKKQDQKLDKTLENTFPASDATAKY